MKVSSTFICEDDVPDILRTGCQDIHVHDHEGHNQYRVCNRKLADLLEGSLITVEGGKMLKAVYSSEFTDLGDLCI